ncbi:MAG: sulfotransferase domain-containing protein [Candidatus Jettenia sp.]|nr:MAG: sulfotransferase domain-containing protein [Candidatus Jettenia sp.]
MKTELNVKDYRYLIIGGTTKAATTSLFFYLKDHPQICAANRKETRFFLDADYPVPSRSKYRFEDGLDKYEQFYIHCTNMNVRMEATPDYLYSQGTPQKIKQSLPEAKIVFILREPASRLISWYKFAKQNNFLPEKITFDKYIKLQLEYDGKDKKDQYLLALEQGRYSVYLNSYINLFGNNRILVVFYEDLSNNPMSVLKEICSFVGIAPEFYNNYDFKVFNRTETLKSSKIHSLYIKLRVNIRTHSHNKPYIHFIFKRLRSMFEPLYLYLNVRSPEDVKIFSSTENFLRDYYKGERQSIEKLIGKTIPWKANIF